MLKAFKHLYVSLLLLLLALPLYIALIPEASSASTGSTGDKGKINISVYTYPAVDKYGFPSVNPDGTFYPGDQFWINYKVYVGDVSLEGVEAIYDQSAFEKFSDEGWGSLSGRALFRVKAAASPGNYTFTVRAWSSSSWQVVSSGTVKVTYGGVKVEASYEAECRLTILASDHGTTSPSPGSYWYAKGSSVSVTALPDTYYALDYWILDGANAGSSNPINVVMDKPHVLQAVFRRIQYPLSISASSGGTTSPPPGTYYYDAGTYASVSAIPYANYTFSHWVLDGADAGSSNPISVFMDKSHSLQAVFEPINSAQQTVAYQLQSVVLGESLSSPASEPKLVIKDLKWTTWFDFFRGTVCQATGYLYDSNGRALSNSDVVVEFRKRNFWTGATWIVSKTVKTGSGGRFVAEETCNPLAEHFIGVEAWAEKPGYIPSWSLSIYVDPVSGEVGQGESLVVGYTVMLHGRFTSVPVRLSAGGLPQGCSATFDPPSANVSWLEPLQGAMIVRASANAPLGSYTLTVTASSGKVSSSAQFAMKVVSPVRSELSGVTFVAKGLDADATGTALTLDGNLTVSAEQLPYAAQWNVGSTHSFAWSSVIGSKVDGKRYVLKSVNVTERYLAVATVTVEVVKYDPHFTVFAYTVPNSPGNNSYEKPFAMIIRYDGNGPEHRLDQRAVIESWSWWGYASRRMLQQQLLNLPLDPTKMSPEELAKLFQSNSSIFAMFTKGVQFSAIGLEKTEGVVLKVDGEGLTVDDLPKTYDWPVNSTHTYEWSTSMPVYKWVEDLRWGTGHWEKADDEWYGWDNTYVSPPQLNTTELEGKNQTEVQSLVLNAMLGALNSPKGTIVAKETGCKIMASYAHNRLLTSIASDAGVQQAVKCLNPEVFPMFFNGENRYAKVVFQLDGKVASETLRQLFNSSIYYEITFSSSMFVQHSFKANFTCTLEYYRKTVELVSWRWDPIGERYVADRTVAMEAVFDTAFNFTYRDYMESLFREEAPDETVLNMALEDLGECPPQYAFGLSPVQEAINRTSPIYYNLNATAGWGLWDIQTVPEQRDAWTETLKPEGAFWSHAPKSEVSTSSTAAYGSASIKASTSATEWPGAILYVLKPVRSAYLMPQTPRPLLRFKLYLGDGCTGDVTVYISTSEENVNSTLTVAAGRWQNVTVPLPLGRISTIGIYARVGVDGGWFLVDDLSLWKAEAWKWTESVRIEGTVAMDFKTDEPYRLYANLDPLTPLPVNVTLDDCKRSELTINALPELGGLKNVTVYLVTSAPTGYTLKNIPLDRLTLKPLLFKNLTEPLQKVQGAENYAYYQGYLPTYTSTLGFQGNATLSIFKTPEVKALPGFNASLLVVEAYNVWGTKFYAVVAVQPWAKTFWEVVFEQIAMALMGMAIAAVIVGLVVKFWRESKGQF